MKKLVMAAAVLSAAFAMADDSGIVSSSIVGYTTVNSPTPGGYKALTVSFDNVGETPEVPVAGLVTVGSPAGAANVNLPGCDQIWRWDTENNTWNKYYYRKVGTQAAVGWCAAGTTVVTTDTIPCGETFFFYRGTAGAVTTLTLSGEVKEFTASTSYSVTPGSYCFVGYPWPVALSLSDFEKYQGSPAGAANVNLPGCDQIWRWDTQNNTWLKYYYRKVGTQAAVGWCNAGTTVKTSDTVPAGEGFFFYRGTAGATDTITFTYPTSEE